MLDAMLNVFTYQEKKKKDSRKCGWMCGIIRVCTKSSCTQKHMRFLFFPRRRGFRAEEVDEKKKKEQHNKVNNKKKRNTVGH